MLSLNKKVQVIDALEDMSCLICTGLCSEYRLLKDFQESIYHAASLALGNWCFISLQHSLHKFTIASKCA